MLGRIIASSGGIYSVESDGVIYRSFARGLFRHLKTKPIVGDLVEFNENSGTILAILDRKSQLKRPIIANIDQIFIVFSLCEPEFSYLLAFKYLTYANLNGVKAYLVLTKEDKVEDKTQIEDIKSIFETLNIEVKIVSNKSKLGIEELRELFKEKVSCLMGQTGVGKSSLLNAIDPQYSREVGEYSNALGRGKHKTKEVILLPFDGGYIADTPGFSSLDLGLYKEDLAKYFPGFDKLYTKCYFTNCLHLTENKCAVKQAILDKKIPEIAYNCYEKLSAEAISELRRYEQ